MMESKKKSIIVNSIRPKRVKRPIRSEYYDDYEDEENEQNNIFNSDDRDDDQNEDHFSIVRPRKIRAITNHQNKELDLPGGVVKSTRKYDSRCIGSGGLGEAPREVVRKIRQYLDVLLNSVVLEARFMALSSYDNSSLAIPGVVSAILEYNNISFKTIKYCLTKLDLFEPVWYTYSIEKNELILFINEAMYSEYCSRNSKDAIIFTSGIIPIEIFNPYETNPNLDSINLAMIHCAIVSDHVAQHIINDIYCKDKILCADIHDRFTEVGTTLHSMFYLEKTCSKIPKREYSNYLTIGTSTTPMLRSTQRILDSIIATPATSSSNFDPLFSAPSASFSR